MNSKSFFEFVGLCFVSLGILWVFILIGESSGLFMIHIGDIFHPEDYSTWTQEEQIIYLTRNRMHDWFVLIFLGFFPPVVIICGLSLMSKNVIKDS